MKKVSIFVDVQNIYYTTKQQFRANFDYNKFWKLATSQRYVVGAFAYTTNRGDERQIQFQNILRAIGFEVKLKPYISRSDGSSKGDWDVGITIDVLEYASKSDIIVLASGDGDFDMLIHRIRKLYNNETEIYGVSGLTANSLKNVTSHFFPIGPELILNQT
ncbi:MAG: nuclease [Methylococcaceae bacterium TMED69]|nr:MAG: nuclease [Methylococcaceae bacterium TMED69]|tara:strand:+ start:92 stop:574 length:483 start_codon:yes stop_codon:yes gene_type:complete